ncbi:MAG: DUF3109 family protein [Bacteroidota bacterium]
MLVIGDKIISDEVIENQFVCQLDACKGACCWEGDYGAPLEKEELEVLEAIFDKIKPFLTREGIATIEEKGVYSYFKKEKEFGTTLLDNGACAYMTLDESGVAKCGIEQAYNEEVIDFKKPISCHLYPVRTKKYKSFEALNYDHWEICSAACSAGKAQQVPVYRFVKDALVRKYGEEFYEALEDAAAYHQKRR